MYVEFDALFVKGFWTLLIQNTVQQASFWDKNMRFIIIVFLFYGGDCSSLR